MRAGAKNFGIPKAYLRRFGRFCYWLIIIRDASIFAGIE